MSSQIINKNIMYGIFAIIYYGLTRHTVKIIRSEKYIVLLRKSLERSGNFKNSYNAYSVYYNSNLGRLPMQFSGNFIEQSLKNHDSKHLLQYQKIFLDQCGSQGCRNGLEKKR